MITKRKIRQLSDETAGELATLRAMGPSEARSGAFELYGFGIMHGLAIAKHGVTGGIETLLIGFLDAVFNAKRDREAKEAADGDE